MSVPGTAVPAAVVSFYQRNEQKLAIAAFLAGFLFDIFTFARVDSWLSIGQQAAYLALISVVLGQMFLAQGAPATDLAALPRLKRWYLEYRGTLVHFLFGSLLNLYAILYFKSSSLLVSSGFMAALVILLVANELPRFKALGLAFKFAILALCMVSFAACVVPIAAGSIGVAVFLASLAIGALPMVLIGVRLGRGAPEAAARARKQVLVPAGLVLIAFLGLYFFRLIPPVPLSIPFMGVYHGVERKGDAYLLAHETPAWRFWHHGDQWFTARPGDRVFVYFRIFSPSRFADEVRMRWFLRDAAKGWQAQDAIPIRIVGGREQGFRGYGFKTNYQPGQWKVHVETADGREIGRIYFKLETAPDATRDFSVVTD